MRIKSLPSFAILAASIAIIISCADNKQEASSREKYFELQNLISALPPIDSLTSENKAVLAEEFIPQIQALPLDTIPTELYTELLNRFNENTDSAQYYTILNDALAKAQEQNDSLAQGIWLYNQGNFFKSYAQYEKALNDLNKSYELFNILNDPAWAGKSKLMIAHTYYLVDDFVSAERHAYNALKIFDEAEVRIDNVYYRRAHNLLALIESALKEYDKALEHYKMALATIDRNSDTGNGYQILMNNLGSLLHEKEDYLGAKEYYNIVVGDTALKKNNEALYARALVNLARANFELGELDSVENQYKEALGIRERINDNRGLPRSHYFLAEYYLKIGDTTRAIAALDKGAAIARVVPEFDGLQDIMKLQIKAAPERAPGISEALFKLQDSLLQEERSNRNKLARIEYETEEYIARNQFLSRQRLLWIGVALGVILIGITVFYVISMRVRHQKYRFQQQQQEANQEIFNLMLGQNEKIEEGKKAVQKRISEELHDGVLGEMNGVRMVLLGLNGKTDEASKEMRALAIEKLKGVQEEIRGISHQLSDAAYQKFHNFIISLEELVAGTCDAAGLRHRFEYDSETDWDGLQGEVKINLYRILQECLQNTIKHAQASEVVVEMISEPYRLGVRIRDNGIGFQPGRGKKGIGHKNIASRVKKLGGRWKIQTAPGQGTEVRLQLPHHGGQRLAGKRNAGLNPAHADERIQAT